MSETGDSRLPEVLILGAFPFPEGAAASNVLRGHARAILAAGYGVGMLADQLDGRDVDRMPDRDYCYRGIPYWSVHRRKTKPRFLRLFDTLLARNDDFLAWLGSRRSLTGVRAICVYPGSWGTVPLIWRLRRLCHEHGIKLFVFVVEWHELRHFVPGVVGFLGILDGELQRRWLNRRVDGVLCISRYLQDYYRKTDALAVRFPPLLDLHDPIYSATAGSAGPTQQGEVVVQFAGSAARDRHDLILRAVRDVRIGGLNVVLEYIGSSREAVASLPGVQPELLAQLGDAVRFRGRVSAQALAPIMAAAHFGLLFREDSRWSRACFPSKVPEYLAHGVPLLCNLSSDLREYLMDGRNALLVADLTVESLAATLRRAASLSPTAYQRMRDDARMSASAFDGRRYSSTYSEILGGASPISQKI